MNVYPDVRKVMATCEPTIIDVPYGADSHQVMDVWLTTGSESSPCVFYIHGGGWVGGDKSNIGLPGGPDVFLEAGISFVSINYRYLPQVIIDTASRRGTAPIQPRQKYEEAPVWRPLSDAARALQFVRSKAEAWKIDPLRVAVSGTSAGACSALWLAFHPDLSDPESEDPVARQSSRPCCAAVMQAQTTLDPRQMVEWTPNSIYGGHAFGYIWDMSDKTAEFRAFLQDGDSVRHWIKRYSPYALVAAEAPPIYLGYTTDSPACGVDKKDPTHTANFGAILEENLKNFGVDYEFVHPGVAHPRHPTATDFLIDSLVEVL